MFSKIRYSISEKLLVRKVHRIRRTKKVHNFKTCERSAIIYDATNAENFSVVREFMKFLTDLSIETELIGYVSADHVHSDLLLRENCHFFCNKDLSLLYKPKTAYCKGFITRKFDIIFDLTLTVSFPLLYLTALSLGDFKVGRFREDDICLDLMIDIRKDPQINYLIEQIKNYVDRLNNPDRE